MKNKNVISSVVGASFFAVGYLVLAVPLAPALALGVVSFTASELIINGSKKEEIKELTIKEKIALAKQNVKHIKEMIPKIDNESIQSNLEDIVKSANKIVSFIEKNNLKNKTVTKFLDYYLPVTVKIVDRYDEIEDQSLTSTESKKFMKDTIRIISDTSSAFKKILDSLYQSDIVNADAEMKVFDTILKSDGYYGNILEKEEGEKDE